MNYKSVLRASLCAALIIGTSAYLSQTAHPFLAGLLIATPVALPSLFFIDHPTKEITKEYIKGYCVSITIYFIVVLFFTYNIVLKDHDKKRMIFAAMALWFILFGMIYLLLIA